MKIYTSAQTVQQLIENGDLVKKDWFETIRVTPNLKDGVKKCLSGRHGQNCKCGWC